MKVSVFGATGGVASSAVKILLQEGHDVVALVRTPQRLIDLCGTHEHLRIDKGDVRDKEAVKRAMDGTSVVILGVGAKPSVQLALNPYNLVTVSDKTLCEDAAKVICAAANELARPPKKLIAVSSTGISETRDVPYAFLPLYRLSLHVPHADKKKMEEQIKAQDAFSQTIIVRGALFTDGPETKNYRVGEGLLGYTISRSDVGHFITKCCSDNTWVGKSPVVVY